MKTNDNTEILEQTPRKKKKKKRREALPVNSTMQPEPLTIDEFAQLLLNGPTVTTSPGAQMLCSALFAR